MSEITQLKQRIGELEARIAALEPKPAPPVRQQEERRAGMFYPPAPTEYIEPTPEQLRRLLDLVYAKHPALARRLDTSSATFNSIQQTMFAFGVMKRTPQVDYSKSAGLWISEVEKILTSHHRTAHVHTAILCAAALCHNDIDVGFQWPENGFHDLIGLGFALSPYVGNPTTNAWQRLLDGSAPPRSLVRPSTDIETKSPFRVYS